MKNKEGFLSSDTKELIVTGFSFVFGTFGLALCYNLFFVPYNLVSGGTSGLAIVVENLTGFSSQAFIYICAVILLGVCYFFLGKEVTKRSIIGTFLYPLFITFTEPIAKFLLLYFSFQEILVTVILAGLLNGFSNGLIYKYGYNTGGSDIIVLLLRKYCHISEGTGTLLFNSLVVLAGAYAFGVDIAVYAIIILIITSLLTDKLIMGISDSKKFMIYTREARKVRKVLDNEFKTGYTIFPTVGGYSHVHGAMIMCVISNRDTNLFKDRILDIDPHAFFVVSDCYEVRGGVKRSNLPFI